MTVSAVTVALLDTGVDANHPDLSGHVITGTSILDGSGGLTDPNGHGTWLAGIIAANTNNGIGIAGVGHSDVNIMPVTVIGPDGTGQDSDIIARIVWAVDHGADVILMGFSNPGFSQHLQDAIDYAWAKGAVLVAPTGNESSRVTEKVRTSEPSIAMDGIVHWSSVPTSEQLSLQSSLYVA